MHCAAQGYVLLLTARGSCPEIEAPALKSRLLPCSQCMHGAVRAYIPQLAHQAGEG